MIGMNKSVFFGTLFTVAVSLSGYAKAEISPQVRQQIRTLVTRQLRKCYDELLNGRQYSDAESRDLQWDIDILCGVLSDEFFPRLTEELRVSLNPCDDASKGLRAKLACQQRACKIKGDFLTKYLLTVFDSRFPDEKEDKLFPRISNFLRECENWDNRYDVDFSKLERRLNEKLKQKREPEYRDFFSNLLAGIFEPIAEVLQEETYFPRKMLKLEGRVDRHCNAGEGGRLLEVGLLKKGEDEINPLHVFDEVFVDRVCGLIYWECIRQLSPKIQIYYRMFLFFNKEIPESDAALFYGEEVFRAFLRMEHAKRSISSKKKTCPIVGRFQRLANEIIGRHNTFVSIAKAEMKNVFFGRSFGDAVRSGRRLPDALKLKIEREVIFIDRMQKRLESMRDGLDAWMKHVLP